MPDIDLAEARLLWDRGGSSARLLESGAHPSYACAGRWTRMRVYELVIESDREEHIARHRVSVEEAEAVVFGESFMNRTQQDRYLLIGQTDAGRYQQHRRR